MTPLSISSAARPVREILVLVLLALLAGCGLFGGDEEENPPAELVDFEPALKIRKAWSAGIGGGTEHLRLALVAASDGSRIFAAAHDGRIAAFDAVKGKRLWRRKTKLPLSAGPATDGAIVLAGSSDGDVVALNAADGNELWRTVVSSEVLAQPAISGDYALVRTVDGRLSALRLADGAEAWFVLQAVPRLTVRGTGSPVVAGDTVIAGFDNGRVAAYDVNDGSQVWDILLTPPSGRTEIERLHDINADLLLVGDTVFAVGYHGSASAIAAEGGQVLWSSEISSYSGMAADFVNVYITATDGRLYALARRSGREMWTNDTLLNRDVTGPATVGNSVVVGDFEGYVHWFDASTGELQARVRAGGDRIVAAPLVVGGMVYVLNEGGKLYAFRDATKKN